MSFNWKKLVGCKIEFKRFVSLNSAETVRIQKWIEKVVPDPDFNFECMVFFTDGDHRILLKNETIYKNTFRIISHGRRLLVEKNKNHEDL